MMIESCSSNSMFQETNSTNNTSRLKKYLRKMDQNLLLTTGSPCFYSFCQSRTWLFAKIQRGCCLYITLSNVLFKNSLIAWKSKKHDVVSRSSTEVEFMSMANANFELGVTTSARFFVITNQLRTLPRIQSFTNSPNMWRQTATRYMIK